MPSNTWRRKQNVRIALIDGLEFFLIFFVLITASGHKKLQRIHISVSPSGIDTFDIVTGETLHRISIYKISYCSADAAHRNIFAFIAGDADNEHSDNENETLKCYAYICPNRKIAHKLTLTVAKCFQRAYDQWTKSEQRRKSVAESTMKMQMAQISERRRRQSELQTVPCEGEKIQQRNLLIDFNGDFGVETEPQRNFFQNTWISFEDTPNEFGNKWIEAVELSNWTLFLFIFI